MPKFIITQIRESEIIGINKIDSTDEDKVFSIRDTLQVINPGVRIFEFSARDHDEGFRKFLETLVGN